MLYFGHTSKIADTKLETFMSQEDKCAQQTQSQITLNLSSLWNCYISIHVFGKRMVCGMSES